MEKVILRNLVSNKEYTKKVIPYLKTKYFDEQTEKVIFKLIQSHIFKYKNIPVKDELYVEISRINISESLYADSKKLIDEIYKDNSTENYDWLIENTEKWIKKQALFQEVLKISEIFGKDPNSSELNNAPDMLQKALQICFEQKTGIEFLDENDINLRWKKYHDVMSKYSTGINVLDKVFNGGIEPKSLTCILCRTNGGKSNAMISMASDMARNGIDVLYITLEMAEEKIAQRIDANFLEVPINDIVDLDEKKYKESLLYRLKTSNVGRLVVKEYPPASINTNHIRSLLQDLELKKNFKPKVIFVDYINLMLSTRVTNENSYTLVKCIAEELRGLAVEKEYAIVTATQGNRAANASAHTDLDMTNVSESIGLAFTVDAMIGIIFTEELRTQNLQIWKIMKNRFGSLVDYMVPVKINFSLAKVYDVDSEDLSGIKIVTNSPQPKVNKTSGIVVEDDYDTTSFSSTFDD